MKTHSALFGFIALISVMASASPARAIDPCWYELTYNQTSGSWQIGSSSSAIGCASLLASVSSLCAGIYAQTEQRDGEINCCWIDQNSQPNLTYGFEPGWCRWPNG